jgi:hypothetical protein
MLRRKMARAVSSGLGVGLGCELPLLLNVRVMSSPLPSLSTATIDRDTTRKPTDDVWQQSDEGSSRRCV